MDSYERVAIDDVFPCDTWRTAASCGPDGGNCVEVNLGVRGLVGIRDSKPAAGPVLVFAGAGWAAFVAAVKHGA